MLQMNSNKPSIPYTCYRSGAWRRIGKSCCENTQLQNLITLLNISTSCMLNSEQKSLAKEQILL